MRKKKQTKEEKQFHAEVLAACKRYSEAAAAVNTAEDDAEQVKWVRAAKGYAVKEAAAKHKQPFLHAVVQHCSVSRPVAVMDCKAEEMRRRVKIAAGKLPRNSLSAFYELHRGRTLAMSLAGANSDAILKVEMKIRKIGKAIALGNASVRTVKQAFAADRKEMRMKGTRAKRPVLEVASAQMVIERLDADALKDLVDSLVVPSGLAVPVVRIAPTDITPQAIDACTADPKLRQVISTACPTKGPLFVLFDFTKSEEVAADLAQPLLQAPAISSAKSPPSAA
ncbi:MAG TPA: hypothetical protein VGP72_27675 [Planctomycetota bacterium]|jgi:hypothetical protein